MNPIIESDIKQIVSCEIIDWDRFRNRTILITGANGILASYLVYVLLNLNKTRTSNTKVLALVRNLDKARNKFKDCVEDPFLEFIVQDVSTEFHYLGQIDFIVHAASQASPKYYGIDPVGTIDANVLGTINTLKLAKEKCVESYLYFSSGEIYGTVDTCKFPIKEDDYGYIDLLKVRSCYAESKRMGENLCVSWNFQYGINAKIVRPFHTYGPGMDLNDGRVFADFCKSIVNDEDIVMHSDGSALRPFCYLADATIAYFKILLDGKNGEAYNVGNPHCEISIARLAEILVRIYPAKHLKIIMKIIKNDMTTVKMKSPLLRSLPSIEKIKSLGWVPSISIEEGFKRTIDSYK